MNANEVKLKNIFAFLSILFGEDLYLSSELMDKSPEYLIEKWERYVMSVGDEHFWGMHPNLRSHYFDEYFRKWQNDIHVSDGYFCGQPVNDKTSPT